jgi:hypothetical protein
VTPDRLALVGSIALIVGAAAIWWPLGAIVAGVIMLTTAVLWAALNVRSERPDDSP